MASGTDGIPGLARGLREEVAKGYLDSLLQIFRKEGTHVDDEKLENFVESNLPPIEDFTRLGVKIIESNVESLRLSFFSTNNPCFVWEAYKWCRSWGLPNPEWVFEYFDGCANKLADSAVSSLQMKGKSIKRNALNDIFGFKSSGQGSYIARKARSIVKDKAIAGMGLRIEGSCTKTKLRGQSELESIIQDVADRLSAQHPGLDITFEMVRTWWREHSPSQEVRLDKVFSLKKI
jgi:hypothetical protein